MQADCDWLKMCTAGQRYGRETHYKLEGNKLSSFTPSSLSTLSNGSPAGNLVDGEAVITLLSKCLNVTASIVYFSVS